MAQLVISCAGALAVFLAVYIKKKSLILSFLLSPTVFLSLLFLFNYQLTVKYRKEIKETVCLLVDKSRSVPSFNPGLLPDDIKVFYFADTVSENTNRLNDQYTALYDSLNYLKIKFGGNTKIAVISDFNDNYSYIPFEKLPDIYPIIIKPVNKTNNDPLSLTEAALPEYLQSGQKENIKIKIESARDQKADLKIIDSGRNIRNIPVHLKPGENESDIPLVPGRPGFHIISFTIDNKEDRYTNNNSIVRAIDVLPEFYKILLISGKPSAEFAFIRRFLAGLKWIKTDAVVLKEYRDKIRFPECLSYNGIILLDLKDSQFSDLTELIKAIKAQKPIFYEPGLNEYHEMRQLLGLFSIGPALENFKEKTFNYDNSELIVKTALDEKDLLIEPLPRSRVFFGFDTWKWDFSRLGEDIAYNLFAHFWQNNVNFLIGDKNQGLLFNKLNYITGENNPAGVSAPGIYRRPTNRQETLYSISDNPMENGMLTENRETAAGYNSNFIYLDQITNLGGYLKNLRNGKITYQNAQFEIGFRNNIIIFLLIVLCSAAFWILKDYFEIKG